MTIPIAGRRTRWTGDMNAWYEVLKDERHARVYMKNNINQFHWLNNIIGTQMLCAVWQQQQKCFYVLFSVKLENIHMDGKVRYAVTL